LLLDGHVAAAAANAGSGPELTLADEVAAAMREGWSEKDALKRVAKARGLGKSEAYREWQRVRR
jgi:16S rRNA (cytidine1402-2'-O)-methyltransferase